MRSATSRNTCFGVSDTLWPLMNRKLPPATLADVDTSSTSSGTLKHLNVFFMIYSPAFSMSSAARRSDCFFDSATDTRGVELLVPIKKLPPGRDTAADGRTSNTSDGLALHLNVFFMIYSSSKSLSV
jgi:hypothetical protein